PIEACFQPATQPGSSPRGGNWRPLVGKTPGGNQATRPMLRADPTAAGGTVSHSSSNPDLVPEKPDRAAFDRTAAARAGVDLTHAPAYTLDAVYAASQALGIA